MQALRHRAREAQGAWLRWQIPEEDRHSVHRKAIKRLFLQAKGLQMEARLNHHTKRAVFSAHLRGHRGSVSCLQLEAARH